MINAGQCIYEKRKHVFIICWREVYKVKNIYRNRYMAIDVEIGSLTLIMIMCCIT